jgi:hypothetical protein
MLHQNNEDLIKEHDEVSKAYEDLVGTGPESGGKEKPNGLLGEVGDMKKLIQEAVWVDVGMAKVVNHCFLTLLYNNYWKLIEEGKLRPGSPESEVLLTSVRISLSPYRADLVDFKFIHEKMLGAEDAADDEVTEELAAVLTDDVAKFRRNAGSKVFEIRCFSSIATSWKFNALIMATIIVNSAVVCFEELVRTCENEDHLGWIFMNGLFTLIFFVEFIIKFACLHCDYFKDSWNRFDFMLVVLGVFGLVVNIITHGGSSKLGGAPRVLKLARILRTMRFLRVFRLFNARLSADKYVSLELAKHMQKITTMSCFITAHIKAENEIVAYFGGNGLLDEVDEAEIARCILQSQVSVYKALIAAAQNQNAISPEILHELEALYKRREMTEKLSHFVEQAHADGAINAVEAHAILHSLHNQIAACMRALNERSEGVISKDTMNHFVHGDCESRRVSCYSKDGNGEYELGELEVSAMGANMPVPALVAAQALSTPTTAEPSPLYSASPLNDSESLFPSAQRVIGETFEHAIPTYSPPAAASHLPNMLATPPTPQAPHIPPSPLAATPPIHPAPLAPPPPPPPGGHPQSTPPASEAPQPPPSPPPSPPETPSPR